MHLGAGVKTVPSLGFHRERESRLLAYTVAAALLVGSPARLQGDPHWSRHLRREFPEVNLVCDSSVFHFPSCSDISLLKVGDQRNVRQDPFSPDFINVF